MRLPRTEPQRWLGSGLPMLMWAVLLALPLEV